MENVFCCCWILAKIKHKDPKRAWFVFINWCLDFSVNSKKYFVLDSESFTARLAILGVDYYACFSVVDFCFSSILCFLDLKISLRMLSMLSIGPLQEISSWNPLSGLVNVYLALKQINLKLRLAISSRAFTLDSTIVRVQNICLPVAASLFKYSATCGSCTIWASTIKISKAE